MFIECFSQHQQELKCRLNVCVPRMPMLTSVGLTLHGRMLQLPLKSFLARGTMDNATAEGPNVNHWYK